MNRLLIASSILLILVLTACGGGSGAASSGGAGDMGADTGCPIGEHMALNGNLDYISVGNDGMFQMERNGSQATGYVTCTGNQKFVLTIESSFGNCTVQNGCASDANSAYHDVQDVGVYQCQYSVANHIITVWCPPGKSLSEGNFFATGKSYYQ